MVTLNFEELLDELKEVKEDKCLNMSYDGRTEIEMKEVPTSIITRDTYEIFHCDTVVVLTIKLKKTYFSLKNLAKISEICYKYSDDVRINLEKHEITIRWKR